MSIFEIICLIYFIIALIIVTLLSIFLKINVNKENFSFFKTIGTTLLIGIIWPLFLIISIAIIEEERII